MPAIAPGLGARDTIPQLGDSKDPAPPEMGSSAVWIVAVVVGGIIFIGVTLTILLIFHTKRRQHRRDQKLRPYFLGRDDIPGRRKLGAGDVSRQEEECRRHMIRKSLATRSSASSRSSFSAMMDQVDQEAEEMERRESTRLKDDWKRWEARIRQERSISSGQHPAANAASGVPIIAIPSPAKHRSQGRTSITSPSPGPPPPPPRHPGRCSPS